MTAFRKKHWMPQNSNTVLPATKAPLSPALSDTRSSGVLQLRARQSTTSSTASFSALKHLIPSISTLNFPTAVLPDNSSSITVSTYNGTIGEDDPPVFDCEDAKDDDDTVPLEETSSNAIRPVQILTERLEAWHTLIKQLHDHFTELANVETQLSKAYAKLSRPSGLFDQANAVLDTHFHYPQGIRSVCQLWQKRHADMEKGHTTLGAFLKSTVLPSLNNMKRELKSMIRSVYMDDRLKLSKLSRLRREAKRRVMRLDRQLAFFDQHPHHGHGKQDPWLLNAVFV
ncbi:hypothetical protein BJV82DRAFT_73225 [Fennellomyces sp. T-0311]|nr:hypothetical protein BJV82DRAFT_73225 [Fennellomyces sp. T-0311]